MITISIITYIILVWWLAWKIEKIWIFKKNHYEMQKILNDEFKNLFDSTVIKYDKHGVDKIRNTVEKALNKGINKGYLTPIKE